MKCDFCGLEFQSHQAIEGCKKCPLASNCSKYKCPRCGYETFPEPGIIKLFTKLKKKFVAKNTGAPPPSEQRESPKCCLQALVDLQPGSTGTITRIDAGNESALKRLLAMGILPGMPVQLVQTFPSVVFKVGNSSIAVDEDVARCIVVENKTV